MCHQSPIADPRGVLCGIELPAFSGEVRIEKVGKTKRVTELMGHTANRLGCSPASLQRTAAPIGSHGCEPTPRIDVPGNEIRVQTESGNARGLGDDESGWGRAHDDEEVVDLAVIVTGIGHVVGAIIVES